LAFEDGDTGFIEGVNIVAASLLFCGLLYGYMQTINGVRMKKWYVAYVIALLIVTYSFLFAITVLVT